MTSYANYATDPLIGFLIGVQLISFEFFQLYPLNTQLDGQDNELGRFLLLSLLLL